MLKRLISIALVLLVFALPVSADVLWEPFDNKYYSSNYEGLEYMDRTYYVPDGMTANLYESPVSSTIVKTLEAGTRIYIGPYGEINGETWAAGYVYYDFDEGWLRLDRLQLEYDHEAFEADFGNQFVVTDDRLTREDIDGDIQTWTYPGSGRICGDFETLHQDDCPLQPDVTWTDGDGRVWGRVGYYMAARGWVCLSEPDNEELPVTEHSYDLYPAGDLSQVGGAPAPVALGSLWAVCGAVALVCGVTAFLIFRMKKP